MNLLPTLPSCDVFSALPIPTWLYDLGNQKILRVNNAAIEYFGYTNDEFRSMTVHDLKHVDDGISESYSVVPKRCDVQLGKYLTKQKTIVYSTIFTSTTFFNNHVVGICQVVDGMYGSIKHVDELKETKEELEKKNAEIYNILESIADGFFGLDKSWRFTYVNSAFEKLLECSREDILGQNYWLKFPKSTQQKFYTEYHKALREQVSVHFEEYASSLDKWVSVSAYPSEDGLTVYFTDITEQVFLKNKLELDRANIRATINNTEDIIWSIDREYKVLSANKAFWARMQMMTGKDKKEVALEDFENAFLREWLAFYDRALSGERFRIVYESVVRDKPYFEEISFNPVVSSDGQITGAACFSRNITDEKLLHDKILKDDQNVNALINNTDDLIWSIDREYRLISVNKPYQAQTQRFTGIWPEPGDQVMVDLFGTDYVEKWWAYYRKVLSGQTFRTIEAFNDLDGGTKYAEISFNPIYDLEGNVLGACCFTRDVTERRLHVLKIEEQNRKLREIAQLQSHQVRGPVATIMGLKQLLRPDDPSHPDNYDVIEGISIAVGMLDSLIREIDEKARIVDSEA